MGLQSAMTTALTGLQAAETTIDVVGNNVANSNTIGFKESNVLFATQFLQTQSIGSGPVENGRGGTNPRQIGLGVKTAAINPDFTQGTVEISANPLDVAIQGDGFLVVEGASGEQFYTRNGQLQTNAANEIVTFTGNRVLGYSVDDEFEIVPVISKLKIPLGEEVVAQATQNAYLTGRLSPTADKATHPGIIQSVKLGDGTFAYPEPNSITHEDFEVVQPPTVNTSAATPSAGGSLSDGLYSYRMTYYTNSSGGAIYESPPSVPFGQATISGGDRTIPLTGISDATPGWDGRYLYRSVDGGPYQRIADITTPGATFTDDGSAAPGATLDDTSLDIGNYSYYVAWIGPGGNQSRPTPLLGSFSASDTNRRIRIDNIPQPPANSEYNEIGIYRNDSSAAGGTPTYYRVATLGVGETTFVDNLPNSAIVNDDSDQQLDLIGRQANDTTRLVDIVVGADYSKPFQEGTLTFTGTKGVRDMAPKELEIDANTNLADLAKFISQAYGLENSDGSGAGVTIDGEGHLVITSNYGIENEVRVKLSAFQLQPADPNEPPVTNAISFNTVQEANGQGTTTDFIVYDSLGIPLNVRITTMLEQAGGNSTTYRWYATSPGNEPVDPTDVSTFLATGTIVFDGQGNIQSDRTAEIPIARNATASLSPLVVTLDFSQVSGLSEHGGSSSMNLKLQDGFSAGTLTSFTISESGLIMGVYSNGAERKLGQMLMARFANSTGLRQVGENLYITGVNSGEPIIDRPGEGGLGNLTAGAVELSNTDIGQNLIELILASTQYRGGARVITAAQELLDELMALRR